MERGSHIGEQNDTHFKSNALRPAVKGATDTSNFDDYPDSDQEPPAVNALGTSGPEAEEIQFGMAFFC